MTNFHQRIGAFIDALAQEKVGSNTFNQYAYDNSDNDIRRKNLELYLTEVYAHKPEYLLLSEAPGYKGARLTGVPFTSEFILLNGIEPLGMFGKDRGYRKTTEFEKEHKEQSATIVWKAVKELGRVPLFWGSFPFHPYHPGDAWSNRRPDKAESEIGKKFFNTLIDIFGIRKIIAVGRVAEASLISLGIEHTMIRHPANGGANDFRRGLFGEIK